MKSIDGSSEAPAYINLKIKYSPLEMENGDVIDAISVKPRNQLTVDAVINVTVINNRQDQVYFRIKKSTTLSKLISAYCNRFSMHEICFVFLFNGLRLRKEHTAEELGMENGDEIDVMPNQPLCGSCSELL